MKEIRDDAIIATGRSDYPNQVNNVLGFPYIFRGALDVRAKDITQKMKMAATMSLAELAENQFQIISQKPMMVQPCNSVLIILFQSHLIVGF